MSSDTIAVVVENSHGWITFRNATGGIVLSVWGPSIVSWRPEFIDDLSADPPGTYYCLRIQLLGQHTAPVYLGDSFMFERFAATVGGAPE